MLLHLLDEGSGYWHVFSKLMDRLTLFIWVSILWENESQVFEPQRESE